ncbi:hypothetical protein [Methylosinus sp. LW4]|uniref:hypothetical protein n=1 Tax=Methylosinus sp. LW4 TaxID=136993 RepID=UPI003526FD97
MFGQKPAFSRRRSRRRSGAADDRPKTEEQITSTADRHARQTGEFYFGASGEIKIGIYTKRQSASVYLKALASLELLQEIEAGREKIYTNPSLLTLLSDRGGSDVVSR